MLLCLCILLRLELLHCLLSLCSFLRSLLRSLLCSFLRSLLGLLGRFLGILLGSHYLCFHSLLGKVCCNLFGIFGPLLLNLSLHLVLLLGCCLCPLHMLDPMLGLGQLTGLLPGLPHGFALIRSECLMGSLL